MLCNTLAHLSIPLVWVNGARADKAAQEKLVELAVGVAQWGFSDVGVVG